MSKTSAPTPTASLSRAALDEAATRKLIDQQLRDAGWLANTEDLRFTKGTRPRAGVNQAIAEWPTASGPADYVLFLGLTPLAISEAKRHIVDIPGRIPQALRYSHDYTPCGTETMSAGPWHGYKIPFVFATNGRSFLRQLKEKSGIWFRDVRVRSNHPRPLDGWYTPDGLKSLLAADHAQAAADLLATPVTIADLHDYQVECVLTIEKALAKGLRDILVAMATGTGKTRVAIALLYRLIKLAKFRRILFLVDRETLGIQALNRINEVRLENLQTLAEIYDIKGLDDVRPENTTRLHLATVQGMVQRILNPPAGTPPIPVDQYDCIVVDECHRGYILDREMADTEMLFKDEADYISKYRRILDHFDAVKIGLTATPALHSTEIFGKPIFSYSYRQAVVDGWLVDHEPPIRLVTRLARHGIKWKKGETVKKFNVASGTIDLATAPDEINFEVDDFNKRVITEPFNRAICEELAAEIDPGLPGKTLIFCAKDDHADMVVRLLKEAMEAKYGKIDDDTVMKITGAADKPSQLFRRFQNEKLPKIAATVDLLTTGIDVPEITNLAFIRRVRSRILYEQMLGRATRLCPNLFGPGQDKDCFRIFDAVDIYSALEDFTDMKPVVKDTQTTFAQLLEQLAAAKQAAARHALHEELAAMLRRKRRTLAANEPALRLKTGKSVDDFIHAVRAATPTGALALFQNTPGLAAFLDGLQGSPTQYVIVSDHPDQLLEKGRGYGAQTKPQDYLEGFARWLKRNLNKIPALLVVTTRPRDLTRKQLREIKLALDEAGYPEATLRTAWREWKNQDMAATIVGFIRHEAMGAPLLPYPERVSHAIQNVSASRAWTGPQRQWLQKIANQMKSETIVDREALDRGIFQENGGFARLNKLFDNKLEQLLGDLHEQAWKDAA